MRIIRVFFFIFSISLSTASLALPKMHLSSPGEDCDFTNKACIYLSTNIHDVKADFYYIDGDLTLSSDGETVTMPKKYGYSETYFLWLSGPGDGSYTWSINFTKYVVRNNGVYSEVPDIRACHDISLPNTAGKHLFQITGTTQSITCTVVQ